MSPAPDAMAFGAPGIEPRWTSSAKDGLGTSYHTSCRLWFTLSHGIVNEIYYPSVDTPNTRDLEYLVTDGETFFHEEKRDLEHRLEFPEKDCLLYRLTNSDPAGRYRLIKDVLTDPHRSVFLMHTRLEVLDPALKGKIRLYALLAPHLGRCGKGNSGSCLDVSGNRLLHAEREDVHLVMGTTLNFARRSVGYVGSSDGWRDLLDNRKMDWEFQTATNGNIALMGEVDLRGGNEFILAVSLGHSRQSTVAKLLQSLAVPYEAQRDAYIRQWQRTGVPPKADLRSDTTDDGHLYRLSRCVLLAHEDKLFQGALVASMSIPWGETKDDSDSGGYHLVWTRDLVQSATALLAAGQTGTPLRALIWLATIQGSDGVFPQNCWINGSAYWSGVQLDEIAAPILLAWRLRREGVSFGLFDPAVMIFRGTAFLIRQGPVTAQDRWEENSGYSPSTIATVIAGLVCAAEFARDAGKRETSEFILAYADWMSSHVEDWTVTTRGNLVPGIPRHYLRINPTGADAPDPHPDPNIMMLQVANGGGLHPARNIVGGDFLQLVRLGIRAADHPVILDSVRVLDQVLKRDLPQGPCWRRYNYDGYGQKDDGSAFDGTGVGRSWPLLAGERGHYVLAGGGDPLSFITAMEKFANEGGMLTEQLWDDADLPGGKMVRGRPTGASMPLCWSHAEYLALVRSRHDGVAFDRVEPAFERYVAQPVKSRHEFWSFRHPLRQMPQGKILRLVTLAKANVVWSSNGWRNVQRVLMTQDTTLGLWFADLSTAQVPAGSKIEFTFFWVEAEGWEGRNFETAVIP